MTEEKCTAEKPKNFFVRWLEKLDKKMEEKARSGGGCCCSGSSDKDKKCC